MSDLQQFALDLIGKISAQTTGVQQGVTAHYLSEGHRTEQGLRDEMMGNGLSALISELTRGAEVLPPLLRPPGAPNAIVVNADSWQARIIPDYDVENDKTRCRVTIRRG